jgi:DnaD/phage-associated family protein
MPAEEALMKTFSGFEAGVSRLVRMPERVFSDILPMVDDLAELKVTLHVMWRLGEQRGSIPYLDHQELLEDRLLQASLGDCGVQGLESALERAVERGTLLTVVLPEGLSPDGRIYLANSPKGRAVVEAVARGDWPEVLRPATRPNIFALYEANIGMLTPLIADELREAEETYPPEWVEDAFREAVAMNKRSWRYIQAILRRWHEEGRSDEQGQRPEELDRRRYIDGEYADFIQH